MSDHVRRPAAVVVLAVLLSLTAGCALGGDEGAGGSAAASPTSPPASVVSGASPARPTETPAASACPPAPPRSASSALAAAEVHRDLKRVACDVAQALTTYAAGATPAQIALQVTSDPARRARLQRSARPLYRAGWWSRGRVVYPQMGGLAGGRACVMVVVERKAGGETGLEVVETRTLDVRLIRTGGTWVFDDLASAGGTAVQRPAGLSVDARAVLDDPRIALPDSARWDIYRGGITPSLLRLMAAMADQGPYGVVVLRTGHPHHVFGTARVSQHTVGQAVDLYRVGRSLVVGCAASGAPHALARWLCGRDDLGQLGSPWALADAGGRSFSDTVHLDHLHVAVRD